MNAPFRLTTLAHGGGCGCKLAPSVLQGILAKMPEAKPYANMMVGIEPGDDAAWLAALPAEDREHLRKL